ncbi:RNase H domain-containing protein [Trichonephila clavipes]|uniref:RNase H domain-containing protein n=1 Tax=Trichonephila clavipes TaxID=2585209 RepID=A0A8X6VNS3_TRICX|nr:RNase H domain-containing protein [Trichonephila clavipes]
MKRVILHHISKLWQESWSQQLDNKLHSVKPVIGAWPVMPLRRTDVKLTRLRIGHARFTHRHLLFGEHAPEFRALVHMAKTALDDRATEQLVLRSIANGTTPHMDIIYRQTSGLGIASQDIGDICASEAYLKIDKQ